jgi:predicted nucleic acid-binding Zn ribbon protein
VRPGGAKRRKGKLTPLESVLGGVLGDLGIEGAEVASRLAAGWEQAVGSQIAEHCRPVAIRHGVLEAEVDSSTWAQQLQLQRGSIVVALRDLLGDDAPSDVRFRVGYSRRP